METFVPWAALCALIEPHYPKVENGRPSVDVERMLRMYLIANWINLADEACEDALYDIPAFRDFCWIDLGRERVPDATTLLNSRHLLEGHQIGAALFAKVGELLQSNGMKLSGDAIVDATLIAAPPSTKNREQARDPEMCQSKKGNQWHFGMKIHIGVDSQTGLIHSASVTPGNVHEPGCQTSCTVMRLDSMAIALTGARISGSFSKPSHPTRGTLPISVRTGIVH